MNRWQERGLTKARESCGRCRIGLHLQYPHSVSEQWFESSLLCSTFVCALFLIQLPADNPEQQMMMMAHICVFPLYMLET